MNPLMNPVGSNAEGKLNCINAVVITQKTTVIVIDCGGFLYPKTGAVGGSRIHSGLLRFVPLLLVAS